MPPKKLITEEISNADKLRRQMDISEALYRQMFTNHSAVMLLIDSKSGSIVEANQAAASFYGYPVDVLQQMNIADISMISPQDIANLRREIQAGNLNYFNIPHRLASGEVREVEVNSVPIEFNGRSLLYSIIHDVTERKQAEEAREESAKIAEDIFEFTPDALLTVNQTGTITRVNKQTQVMFGYTREELLNQKIDILIPRHLHSSHAQNFNSFFAEPHNRPMGAGLKLSAIKKDGSEFPVDIILSPLQLGGKTFVTAVVRDISERQETERKYQEAQEKLHEQQRAMDTFEERERMARELHDGIGQTLGYINMQADAVREMMKKDDKENAIITLARLSEVAQEAHRDVRGYIKDLKDSANIHHEFFAALRQYCQHLGQSYLFHVELRLPEIPPETVASAQVETHLIYIIREALGNARRHSGAYHARVIINLDDEYVQAVIEDEGKGIVVEHPGVERRKGSRLGLGIMRERVDDVGGSLRIESEPDKGTRVIVRLPRRLAHTSLPFSRVLIVDDHPLFIEGLKNMLTQRGAQIIGAARNGVEAQSLARDLKPDIILMDLQMPRMSGLEATRLIKTEQPEIKIVILTTSIAEADLFEALSSGASGYLLKGMSADEFMERLGDISRGEAEFSAEMANQILTEFGAKDSQTAPVDLTERQLEILRLVSQGLMYKQIGDRIFLTERTVKYHMGEILSRLQLKNRHEVEEYAKRRGLT